LTRGALLTIALSPGVDEPGTSVILVAHSRFEAETPGHGIMELRDGEAIPMLDC
jgi:hypothetical protein